MDEQRIPQRPPPNQREERECVACGGKGEGVLDAHYDPVGRLTQIMADCLVCEGTGRRSVYTYPEGGRR